MSVHFTAEQAAEIDRIVRDRLARERRIHERALERERARCSAELAALRLSHMRVATPLVDHPSLLRRLVRWFRHRQSFSEGV